MAFDPIQEDCLRLILEGMRRDDVFPLEDAAYIERGMDAYRQDPAQLIRTDRDRSFHLTAQAAELADYRIPFLTDEAEVELQEDAAESALREAVELDPSNWDAQRMLAALTMESNDEYVRYLLDNRADVERDLAQRTAEATDPYSREYVADMGRRPYLRWLAAIAAHALITGQYRISLEAAEASLSFAPHDPGDVRHTAMLALAKLEVPREDLRVFRHSHELAYAGRQRLGRRGGSAALRTLDPWSLIAEMSAAYRSYDFDAAEKLLKTLVKSFPHGAQALFYQAEFPEGVFARVNIEPGSEDELVLAISEATPLLQEGVGSPEAACFSTWVSNHDIVQRALTPAERAAFNRAMGGQGGEN